jgi:hypothetical protein
MSLIYKIHPAVGIARVGNSADAFFVGPEKPGSPGLDKPDNDVDPVTEYKTNGEIKRQAARFRVYEYDQAPGGALTLVREITSSEAVINWTVDLVNRKAALDHTPVSTNPHDPAHPARPRNPGVPIGQLIIRDPRVRSIQGRSQQGVRIDQGRFKTLTVDLGGIENGCERSVAGLGWPRSLALRPCRAGASVVHQQQRLARRRVRRTGDRDADVSGEATGAGRCSRLGRGRSSGFRAGSGRHRDPL